MFWFQLCRGIMASHTHHHIVHKLCAFICAVLSDQIFLLSLSSHLLFIFQGSFQTSLEISRTFDWITRLQKIGVLPLHAHITMLHIIKLVLYNIIFLYIYMSPTPIIKVPQENKNYIYFSLHPQCLLLYLLCITYLKSIVWIIAEMSSNQACSKTKLMTVGRQIV